MRRTYVVMIAVAMFVSGLVVGRKRDRFGDQSAPITGLRAVEIEEPNRILISKIIGAEEQIHPQWRWTVMKPYSVNRGGQTNRFHDPTPGARCWQILIGNMVVCCEEVSGPDERAPADIKLP